MAYPVAGWCKFSPVDALHFRTNNQVAAVELPEDSGASLPELLIINTVEGEGKEQPSPPTRDACFIQYQSIIHLEDGTTRRPCYSNVQLSQVTPKCSFKKKTASKPEIALTRSSLADDD